MEERIGISLHILWMFLKLGLMRSVFAEAIMPQINQSFTCPDRCGNIYVPYPFGIGENCSLPLDSRGSFWSRNFKLECNNSMFNPPRLFADEQEIINITLNPPKLHLKTGVAYICDDGTKADNTGIYFSYRPFYISSEENVHRAFGCNTNSTIESSRFREDYFETCISTCSNDMELADISTCNGTGCCQTKIPPYAFTYSMKLAKFSNTSDNQFSNRCIYSFVMKNSTGDFEKPSYLEKMNKTTKVELVAKWYVGDLGCEEAQKNKTTYACVKNNHTLCQNSPRGMGYFCKCAKGYEGNPYQGNGCQDIDECLEEGKCLYGICINTNGSYQCECPSGTKGDPMKNIPCVKEFRLLLTISIVLGIGLPLLFALGLFTSWSFHKRKFLKLRKQFFRENGGVFLQNQITANPNLSFKIFPMDEIEDATNNFDREMVLGKGGQGIVYKGDLGERRMIAIKRSMMAEERNTKEFANEMLILSQINHVNIVKLLGCCLESEVPILVYEFIPNKTLFDFIHETTHAIPIPWRFRLKIGADTAKAIAYLHSEASPPILHGDIKSSNILLDKNYMAKVSDFGTSTIAPKGKSRFMTLLLGTYGYLDPEYLQTGQLTEKSDVYSFAVVMLELFTGRKAVFLDDEGIEWNLASVFIHHMKDNRLGDILDHQILDEETSMEQIRVVADVIIECLSVTGDKRPTMTYISNFLQGLITPQVHPWIQANAEEVESLILNQDNFQRTTTGDT